MLKLTFIFIYIFWNKCSYPRKTCYISQREAPEMLRNPEVCVKTCVNYVKCYSRITLVPNLDTMLYLHYKSFLGRNIFHPTQPTPILLTLIFFPLSLSFSQFWRPQIIKVFKNSFFIKLYQRSTTKFFYFCGLKGYNCDGIDFTSHLETIDGKSLFDKSQNSCMMSPEEYLCLICSSETEY